MTDAEKAKALMAAQNAFAAADQQYKAALRETYPVGSYVRWRERPYIKAGIVKGYSLSGHSLTVTEGGLRGKQRTVHVQAILLAALEES